MGRAPTIQWVGGVDGFVELIDQTLLPTDFRVIEIRDVETMRDAIRRLAIRGAPAIGIAAAYGLVIALQPSRDLAPEAFNSAVEVASERLASARPTAVNLFWALDRMNAVRATIESASAVEQLERLLVEALAIHEEDRAMCRALGQHGAALVSDGDRLMTHCNAGALATGGMGTALSVFFTAHDQGKRIEVLCDETRPLLQGARLSTWELMEAGVPCRLICDNMAAHAMKTLGVDAIFVGSDRVAANGDAANKIGTYNLAVVAKAHGVPFYVVAPSSTFDRSATTGDYIPIEERAPEEITCGFGTRTAPEGVATYSPAFDVTPADHLAGIVTEKGVISPVSTTTVVAMLDS